MSSRAFRRLQRDADVVRIRGEGGGGDEEETPGFVGHPGRGRKDAPTTNLFALVRTSLEECHSRDQDCRTCTILWITIT